MREGLHIGVLGRVEAFSGRALDLGGAQQRRLLACLAERVGEAVTADRLADALWPSGNLPQNWRGAIRVAASRLRTALEDESAVVSAGGAYRLNVSPSAVDALRFDGGLRSAQECPDARERATLVRAALDEWRGNAYDEFADEPWIEGEARRLDELRLAAVAFWAECLLDLGRTAEAVAELEPWVLTHPLREQFRRLLMIALARSGRQADALATFQDYRRQLATGVGLDPSAELRQLEGEILEGRVASDHRSEPGAGRPLPNHGYQLGERIGEGAFSVVYRGRQPSVGRDVAMKVIRSELANRPEFIRRFESEAHLVANLEHPHIVPLYDYWREPDRAYLVMRWLRGGSLEARFDDGPLPVAQVCRIAEQVGSALTVAHRAGVIHRDVKPANILLDDDGNAYLTDFGIALEASGVQASEAALSAGSPAYAAPEQLRRQPVGPPADVHGLAIALYEAMTGSLPFPDVADQAALLRRQLEDPLPAPSSRVAALGRGVDRVVARATEKLPEQRYQTVAEFVSDLVAALGTETAAPSPRGQATLLPTAELTNPFRGLRAFQEADARLFHGRERLTDELLRKLDGGETEHRLLVIVGPSGAGKSSIVRAGLVPALRQGRLAGSDQWFYVTMVPGIDPFEELETALLRVAVNPPASLREQLTSNDRGILQSVRRALPDDGAQMVLVIDQFEELFTLCDDEAKRVRFINGLIAAISDPLSPLRVIVTLRADFYDRPLRYGALAKLMKTSTATVTPLAPDELERAMVDPVRPMGVEFEPGLVAEIVADVSDQPGALPLLQYALTLLFDRQTSGLLTVAAYRELGGVTGALATRAESLYQESGEEQQSVIRRLFGRLITLGEGAQDTRRRVLRSELTGGQSLDSVLDRLGRARLLSFDREPLSREPTVEVAHEALLREWPRLRGWLEDDRDALRIHRHLTDAARAWRSGGDDEGELYRGGRLEAAADYASTNEADLNQLEQDFLSASVDLARREAEHEQQQVRRLRSLLAGVAVLLAVAMIAGVVAFIQRGNARDGQAEALAARTEAEYRRMASDAAGLVDSSPQVAALLAVEAHAQAPSHLTLGALQQVLTHTGPVLGYLGADRDYRAVAWIGGRGRRVAAMHRGGVDLFDVSTGDRRTIEVDAGEAMAVSADGALVAVGTASGPVEIFSTEDGSLARTLEHSVVVRAIAFGPGGRVATGDRAGWLRLWDGGDKPLEEVLAHPESLEDVPEELRPTEADRHEPLTLPVGLTSLIYHPGEQVWVTAGGAWIRTWSAELELVQPIEVSRPTAIATADSARRVVGRPSQLVVGPGATVDVVVDLYLQTWDLSDGTFVDERRPSVYFSGESTFNIVRVEDGIVTAHSDGRIEDLAANSGGVPQLQLGLGRIGNKIAVAASDDSRLIAAAGRGGVAIISRDGQTVLARSVPRLGQEDFSITSDGLWMSASSTRGDPPIHSDLGTDPPTRLPIPALDEGAYRSYVDAVDEPLAVLPNGEIIGFNRDGSLTGVRHAQPLSFGETASAALGVVAFGGGSTKGPVVDVIDAESEKLVISLDELVDLPGAANVSGLAFSPDGSRLAGATDSGAAVVWDTETWELVGPPISEGGGAVLSLAYSPDGRLLVTSGVSNDAVIRDAATNQPTGRVLIDAAATTNIGTPRAFSFTGDSRYLVTGGGQPSTIFDLEVDQPVGTPFPGDLGGFDTLPALSGEYTVTVDGDRLLIWDLRLARWPDLACRFAGRNLTPEEWRQYGPSDEPYRATCAQWPSLAEEEEPNE